MKSLLSLRFLSLIFLLIAVQIIGVTAQQAIPSVVSAETERVAVPLQTGAQNRQEYQIWAGDVLDLRILGHPELAVPEIKVDERGMIRLPQINEEIPAACRTVKELRAEILSRFERQSNEKYQISVIVTQNNSPYVNLKGAVRVNQLRLKFKPRLLEVLALAGGITETAKGTVEIVHQSGSNRCLNSPSGQNTRRVFKFEDIKRGGDEANPYVYPGDSLIVPELGRVYVTGAVVKAGTILIDDMDTVSTVIEKAGGLSANANINKIEICGRVEGANAGKSFFVDLESIKKREKKDVKIYPGSVIYVFSINNTNGSCKNTLLGLPPTGISY